MHTGDAGEKWFVVGLTIRQMHAASESPAGRMGTQLFDGRDNVANVKRRRSRGC
jgi:hypothetical protein